MKKLGKKLIFSRNTIESYCSCYCGCGCDISCACGKYEVQSNNKPTDTYDSSYRNHGSTEPGGAIVMQL